MSRYGEPWGGGYVPISRSPARIYDSEGQEIAIITVACGPEGEEFARRICECVNAMAEEGGDDE